MEEIISLINSVGFPIFACIYLGGTNQKVLNTLDKKLEVIQLQISELKGDIEDVKR